MLTVMKEANKEEPKKANGEGVGDSLGGDKGKFLCGCDISAESGRIEGSQGKHYMQKKPYFIATK